VTLANFSPDVIKVGESMARIEELLVPAFLMHRYQLQAAGTVLGGRDFVYSLKGDGQLPTQPLVELRQQNALNSLLATLQPSALKLPLSLVEGIPPAPPQTVNQRELFSRDTGYLFDPIAAGVSAADLTLKVVLDVSRAARLNRQAIFEKNQLGFPAVLEALLSQTWKMPPAVDEYDAVLQRRVQTLVVEKLVLLISNSAADPNVRAQTFHSLSELNDWLGKKITDERSTGTWYSHYRFTAARIDVLTSNPAAFDTVPVVVPPGSPI
jgi:hypothetical protein